TSTTRAGSLPGVRGHACSPAGHSGTRAASVDSPAPPWVPTHHSSAPLGRSRVGSWSTRSGAGMPRCGATGPVGGGTVISTAAGLAGSGSAAGFDSHGLFVSDTAANPFGIMTYHWSQGHHNHRSEEHTS